MSTIRIPALGPIVGHTTHESSRLWIAASNSREEQEIAQDRRTIGIIGVVIDGKVDASSISYFRLRREFDRTGTFNLGKDTTLWKDEDHRRSLKPYKLYPETNYTVRMATLTLDDAYPNDDNVSSEKLASKLPDPSVWKDKLEMIPGGDVYAEATFRTQPAPPDLAASVDATIAIPSKPISFLVGSCRYPGGRFRAKRSDKIFGPMLDEALGNGQSTTNATIGRQVNFSLMIGDQIYADPFWRIPIGKADTYEEFQDRYLAAFGSSNMRALLSRVPTYMMLDDHEIEDNWTQDRLGEKRSLFDLAIGAYMSYQWSHGPRHEDSYLAILAEGKREFLKHRDTITLYYDFECAGYPFFVLDTRTQRWKNKRGKQDNHLLGKPCLSWCEPNQLDRLRAWLKDMQELRGNAPKFIVTPSVFLPNQLDERHGNDQEQDDSDSWPAFPNTRSAILEIIVEEKIQNVVFLCGDVHCSCVCRIKFDGAGSDLKAYSIVSSAFFWPWCFADGDRGSFVHNSEYEKTQDPFLLPRNLGTMHYKAWGFTQSDNFCRIDVDPESHALSVQYFDQDGKPITREKEGSGYPGDKGSLHAGPEVLQLAPWK